MRLRITRSISSLGQIEGLFSEEERKDIHEQVEDALAENAEALDQGKVPTEEAGQEQQPTSAEETAEAAGNSRSWVIFLLDSNALPSIFNIPY